MSQTTTPKRAPLDIRQVHSFLGDFRTELTDVMMMAVDEWSADLRQRGASLASGTQSGTRLAKLPRLDERDLPGGCDAAPLSQTAP